MRLCDIFTLFFFMMASRQTAPHPCSCLKKRTSAISAARMGFGVGPGLPGTGKQPSRFYRRNSSLAQRLVMPCCLATCQTGRSPFCSSLIIHETLRLLSFLMYKSILRRNLIRDKTQKTPKKYLFILQNPFFAMLTIEDFFVRLVIATILGALIGFEREA